MVSNYKIDDLTNIANELNKIIKNKKELYDEINLIKM